MKDALGQERSSVRTREILIAVAFAALVGLGIWTVALPALNEAPADEAPADDEAEPSAPTNEAEVPNDTDDSAATKP